MSTVIVKLKRKKNQFNKIFTKEEKLVIILGSIAVLLAFIIGLITLCSAFVSAFNWYIDLTRPYVIDALNNLVGKILPGW